jgi:hypothetical protein
LGGFRALERGGRVIREQEIPDSVWRIFSLDEPPAGCRGDAPKSPPPECGKGRTTKVAIVADDDEDDD